LLGHPSRPDWCRGVAFYRGDLCFINQVEGGSEWLVIKRDTLCGSITFARVVEAGGRAAAQAVLDRLRAASVEGCRTRDY
jgi:hypothetical protein